MNNTESNISGGTTSIGHRIVRGAFVLAFMWFFWKLGGFLMNQVVYYFYGKGVVFDVFTAVYKRVIYLFFFSSLLKIVKPVFMPLFARRMHEDGEEKAWEFASTVINLLLIAAAAIGFLCFIYAPKIVELQLHGFSAERQAAAASLIRWMIPGVAVIAFSIAALAILTSYKVFSYPSAADAVQKFVWAAALFVALGVLGLSRDIGDAPRLIGIAFLAGCAAQGAVLLFGMRKQLHLYRLGLPALPWGRIKSEALLFLGMAALFTGMAVLLGRCTLLPPDHPLHLKVPDSQFAVATVFMLIGFLYTILLWRRAQKASGIMGRFAMLAVPLIISVIFARYADFVTTRFQSNLKYGAFGMVEQARSLALMPTLLFGYALSIVMIPFLADLAAANRRQELGALVGRTLRFMLLFFVPLAIVIAVMGEPTMRLVWDFRPRWSPAEAKQAGLALALLALLIPVLAVENVMTQSFFSIQQTAAPAITGIVFAVLHAGALFAAQRIPALEPYTLVIVCAAEPARRILKNITLFLFLRTRLTLGHAGKGLRFGARFLLIAALAGLAAWFCRIGIAALLPLYKYHPPVTAEKINFVYVGILAARFALPSLAAFATFVIVGIGLEMEEVKLITDWARPRLARLRPGRRATGRSSGEQS